MVKPNGQKHKRCIGDKFREALLYGDLRELLEIVKEDKELLLCFRGSYINIYYKGHSILRVEQQKHAYKAAFNMGHARYTAPKKEIENYIANIVNGSGIFSFANGFVSFNSACIKGFWGKVVQAFKLYIDDHFSTDQDKNYDYFKAAKGCLKKKHLEKQAQQKIMIANKSLLSANDYFIFDMEYDQARNNSEEKKSGRFDMLALRLTENNKLALVFIELKSTIGACGGTCSPKEHFEDLKRYLQNQDSVKKRREDAIEILCLYRELLDLPEINECLAKQIEDRRISFDNEEILFVFTDNAVKAGESFKDCEKIVIQNQDGFCLNRFIKPA